MHVIVVGCGRVGRELTRELVGQGHTVAVIDRNPAAFRRLEPDIQCTRVLGFGFDFDQLEQAGIQQAQALVAVTSGDNTNILCARVARESFGIKRVVARIYDPRRANLYERLGIPTVATVSWTTDQVLRRLLHEGATHDWTNESASVSLVERTIPGAWAGTSVDMFNQAGRYSVSAITRYGSGIVPTSTELLQEGDVAHIMSTADAIEQLDSALESSPGGHS